MRALRLTLVAVLPIAFCAPVAGADKVTTKTIQSVDTTKKTITLKPTKKDPKEQVIEVTDGIKLGWLRAKGKAATLADLRPGDAVTIKEVDGKITEINTLREPPK